jgi:nucleotide-binding universal stress UspA family protein
VAREGEARLLVLFVVDSQIPEMVVSKLSDIGFQGERPGEELRTALLNEYARRGQTLLDEVRAEAERESVSCETMLSSGDFVGESLRVIGEKRIDHVILTRSHRSDLARFLFGSPVNELRRRLAIPIEIVADD